MDAKEAASYAKRYIQDLLADEKPTNIGLEEIEFRPTDRTWEVTVGFSRPWNTSRSAVSALTGETNQKRAYRVVRIHDDTLAVLSMKRREFTAQNVADID